MVVYMYSYPCVRPVTWKGSPDMERIWRVRTQWGSSGVSADDDRAMEIPDEEDMRQEGTGGVRRVRGGNRSSGEARE